jgi:hypothetical protein
MAQDSLMIRGKAIAPDKLDTIRHIIGQDRLKGRTFLSVKICEQLHWFQPNGRPQDVACREILRRLDCLGLISLPEALKGANNEIRRRGPITGNVQEPEAVIELNGSLKDWRPAILERVKTAKQSGQWRSLIGRYHYLGYAPMVGRCIKYFIYLKGVAVGAISWGSPCWKLGPRDSFIGWDADARIRNLQHLAGNHRFLLLPWVKIKNLASYVLSLAARQAARDWKDLYGLELYLLESFVDPSRVKGTCYRAANWQRLGQSKGSSKSGNSYRFHGQVKDIYVYPLADDFKQRLKN